MREHLGFIMPTPGSIGRETLEQHILSVLIDWDPFSVRITGLFKSWDHWLMLGVREGRDNVIRLHDELYSGLMKPHLREDLPFEPHIAIGYFGKKEFDVYARVKDPPLNKNRYETVLKMAEKMEFDFTRTVDRLTLVQFDDLFTHCENLRDFYLLDTV
jgi:2'-5' RNA ligase